MAFYACRCRPATRSSSAKRARTERGRGAPEHERRSLLYKYAPGHMAWASPYPSPADAPEFDYSEQMRRLLEQPYVAPGQDAYGAEVRKPVV